METQDIKMAKNNTVKRHASAQQNAQVPLLLGIVLLAVSYGAASWAIDNGRISLYVVTFVSLIAGIYYLVSATKLFTKK